MSHSRNINMFLFPKVVKYHIPIYGEQHMIDRVLSVEKTKHEIILTYSVKDEKEGKSEQRKNIDLE